MKYRVSFWDDKSHKAILIVTVSASNLDEAEEEAKRIAKESEGSWVLKYPIIAEEATEEEKLADEKAALAKELREFGIETYLHENLKSPTAQLVLSKLCAATLDRLSEEDLDALTE